MTQPVHPEHPEHPATPAGSGRSPSPMAGSTVLAQLQVQSVQFNLSTATERQLLVAIYQQGVKMSAELDHLRQAIADVQTAAAAEAVRVEEIIATLRSSNVSPADIQAAADALEIVAANLNAVEPAPAPAPVPPPVA